jgi:hypothetical protein
MSFRSTLNKIIHGLFTSSSSSTAVRSARHERKAVKAPATVVAAARKRFVRAVEPVARRLTRTYPIAPKMKLSQAVDILAAAEGQFDTLGGHRPTAEQVALAWRQVNPALTAYFRALIHLRLPLPVFSPRDISDEVIRADSDVPAKTQKEVWWVFDTNALPVRNVDIIIRAIWGGCLLEASSDVNDVLANAIVHQRRGAELRVLYENGPPAKREKHVLDPITEADPLGRPIILRLWEYGPGGPLEILDGAGGTLNTETRRRSHWQLKNGWLVADGQRRRDREPKDGAGAPPAEINQPPKPGEGI